MTRVRIPASVRRALAAWVLPALIGLTGAWLALEAFGTSTVTAGPFRVNLDADFGRGVTDIALPPLGELRADTHVGPLHLRTGLQEVDVRALQAELAQGGLEAVADQLETRMLDHLVPFGLRTFALGIGGGLLLGLIAYPRVRRRAEIAALAAVVAVALSLSLAITTFEPRAFLAPSYSGSLELAPKLFGPVEGALEQVGHFRDELRRLVAGAARAYAAVETNPFVSGDEIRVLHISDIHLSTLGMDYAVELARSFDVDVVLDTGDTSSFGTAAESIILDRVPDFERPYVWVRGNHDSPAFQQSVAARRNAVVLDGDIARVGGLVIYGLGDPLFTDERGAPVEDETIAALVRSAGPRIAEDLDDVVPPPDIVAVHDDRMAEAVAGRVPLVVSGHFHRESIEVVSGTIFLEVGTTGGAGPTGFTAEGGLPLSAEILYFRRSQTGEPPSLIAWDVITQLPETGSLQIERHLVTEELGVPSPSPTVTASPATTGSTLSPTSAAP